MSKKLLYFNYFLCTLYALLIVMYVIGTNMVGDQLDINDWWWCILVLILLSNIKSILIRFRIKSIKYEYENSEQFIKNLLETMKYKGTKK